MEKIVNKSSTTYDSCVDNIYEKIQNLRLELAKFMVLKRNCINKHRKLKKCIDRLGYNYSRTFRKSFLKEDRDSFNNYKKQLEQNSQNYVLLNKKISLLEFEINKLSTELLDLYFERVYKTRKNTFFQNHSDIVT